MNALDLLKQDHQTVKDLFQKIRKAEKPEQRKQLFDQIDTELNVHAQIEETVFYPAMEKYEELQEMVEEARTEHQEVQTLIDDMEGLDTESEEFTESLDELIENVEHHAEEEENEMFPKVRDLCDESELEHLGQQLQTAKGKGKKQREAV